MNAPITETAGGVLEGTIREGIRAFEGVPYAEPPVNRLRFAAPQPVPRWTGVRPATALRPPSAQAPRDESGNLLPNAAPIGSEDCLYLNVFAPLDSGRYPVLVWIHGGGGMEGVPSTFD